MRSKVKGVWWVLAASVALLGALAGQGQATSQRQVPVATDLQKAAQVARERGLPLLVEFAATDCGYCEQLEREYLRPMVISDHYDDKVVIRKVLIDPGMSVTDFRGREVSAGDFSFRYGVEVTPTVVLVDHRGDTLSEPLVGINNAFYGTYLDRAIETSLDHLRERAELASTER